MAKEKFTSQIGMVIATAAGAVGLGNIWKFPYVLGQNGGAAFLLVYIACVLLFGFPLMSVELMIGRHSNKAVSSAYQTLIGNRRWNWLPVLTFLSTMTITGLYLVITGWCLGYFFFSLSGTISSVSEATSAMFFQHLAGNGSIVVLFVVLAIVSAVVILWAGVSKGIERLCKILMPLLFVLLFVLVVRVSWLDGSSAGYAFLFRPDWSCITPRVILEAMGQCFYSLSIGMGISIIYGAYMSKKQSILKSSISVVGIDTFVAILAGCAIFPAVFAFGLSPAQGPKLVFEMVPLVFNQVLGGRWLNVLFFALLSIAAITSIIALIETLATSLVEATQKWHKPLSRHRALVVAGLLCLIVSVACIVSGSVFDGVDKITSIYTLPLIALGTIIYFGWFINPKIIDYELSLSARWHWFLPVFRFLIRWFIPLVIILIFLNTLGTF